MAALRDVNGAAHGDIANPEAFLELLREIKEQLAEQSNTLYQLISTYRDAKSPRSASSDNVRDLLMAKRNAAQNSVEHEVLSTTTTRFSRFLGSVDEGPSNPQSSEDFVLHSSSFKKSNQYERNLGITAGRLLIPAHTRVAGPECHATGNKRGLSRHRKPPSLANYFRKLHEHDRYQLAPKVRCPDTLLKPPQVSDSERLDHLRGSLENFRDLPVDHRLHRLLRIRGARDTVDHAEAATQALWTVILGFSPHMTIFDYNELHGYCIYSLSTHNCNGHMQPINRCLLSRAPWTRFM